MLHLGLCRSALCCIQGYVVRHNVTFSIMSHSDLHMSFGIVSFGVMSFGKMSFGVMSFGLLSVYRGGGFMSHSCLCP